jgi:hypothetical protein
MIQRMAFNESPGSGALAWAALLAMQHLDSVPMPQLSGMMKAIMPQRLHRDEVAEVPILQVLPNPASDPIAYVTPLHDGLEQGVLEIYDGQGRFIQAIQLNGRRGLIESSVQGWKPGLYLVRLVLDGRSLGAAKFTVVQ